MNESSNNPRPRKTGDRQLAAIILAAGKGKRMNSDLPKVAHAVAGRPMVWWVVDAVRQIGAQPIVLVIGHGSQTVRDLFDDRSSDIIFVTQEPQLGTGHAVNQARPVFDASAIDSTDIFVLAGDGPLIRPQTLRTLLNTHRRANAAATLATSVIPDPTGYGRIIRNSAGRFARIVEHKDASPAELRIAEVNPSYYCFQAQTLFDSLARVKNDNAAGEYYITDVFSLLLDSGQRVEVIDAVPPEDVLSINDPQQLAEVDSILRSRLENTAQPKHVAEVSR